MFSVICYVALLTGKHLFLKKFKEIYKDISLEKEMATHSGTLAWKIPWMEEHGRLQSMGSLRVGHNWVTSVTSQRYKGFPGGTSGKQPACQCRRHKRPGFDPWLWRSPGEGNGNPLQYACQENPMDKGAWWAAVHWVAKSWTLWRDLALAQIYKDSRWDTLIFFSLCHAFFSWT